MTITRRSIQLTAALTVAAVFVPAASSGAKAPATRAAADPPGVIAVASSSTCRSLYRKAKRYRRGSAKRRKYIRRYNACLRAQRTPTAPAPAAVVYPNPDGYRAGQGCLRSWEARFNAAGFSCQFSGLYQQVYLYPSGWVSNPIYILFPLCADGSGRIC